jgi:alpha-D-ribose 1-methylphosphonate 5-triphosphate synthase subunit PhnH
MFDLVHDSQAVHRALILAFSFPGTPVPIDTSRVPELGLPPVSAAIALTLLDQETTYSHAGPDELAEYTGARRGAWDEAAFLFASQPEDWAAAFRTARRGTLADPQGGATVVGFAPAAASDPWTASGPGLEHATTLNLPSGEWLGLRNQACVEFPLGVDLLWARDDGTVVALPRSTRLVAGRPGEV